MRVYTCFFKRSWRKTFVEQVTGVEEEQPRGGHGGGFKRDGDDARLGSFVVF